MHSAFRATTAALLFAVAVPAFADCPPLGTLPGYEPDSVTRHAYDRYEFNVMQPDETIRQQAVEGPFCQATYFFQGDTPMSALEIQYNYREQLEAMGATFTYTTGSDTHGWFEKDGRRTWFHVYSEDERIDLAVVTKQAHEPTLTAPSGDDHALFGHLPGFATDGAERRNFDEAAFRVLDDEGSMTEVAVQGEKYHARYALPDDGQPVGWPDVVENFVHAVARLGGEIVHREPANMTARFLHDGRVGWLGIYAEDRMYEVTVVMEKPFASTLQVPEADALRAALDAEGRVALYVQFDFGKATLRPDADAVIERVHALLQADPALKLSIEGHTDDVGSDAANLKLSTARAAAVVTALVKRGIAAERLTSGGHGEAKPLADNATSSGRAKNRRVELVKR